MKYVNFKGENMKISTQAKAISNATNNDLTVKLHNEPDFRKTIVLNIDNKNISKSRKKEALKQIELERLKRFAGTEKYESYNQVIYSNISR